MINWTGIDRGAEFSVSGWLDALSKSIGERKRVLGSMELDRRRCMFMLDRRVKLACLLVCHCKDIEMNIGMVLRLAPMYVHAGGS